MKKMILSLLVITTLFVTPQAQAVDDAHWKIAQQCIERGIAFLRQTQNDDGSWTPQPGPAITALIVRAMLDQPHIDSTDPTVKRALKFILSKHQPDGGFHDGFLQNYNTAICLSALSRLNDQPDIAKLITGAQNSLIQSQWQGNLDPQGHQVNQTHAYFGGAGYGKHGRPDMSNTQIMLEGLYDSGLNCNDPAFTRAMLFITRCQGTASNKFHGKAIAPDGGFIYATSLNKDNIGVPQSMAGSQETPQGSRLRTYGSMTYAGFKSYIYANLSRDDPRVVDAYRWIRNNYTVTVNPGMPPPYQTQGLFYYYTTMARALNAWGSPTIVTPDGQSHDWANDLIDQLQAMQNTDGSWINKSSRWMETDPNLVTGYALTALIYAIR